MNDRGPDLLWVYRMADALSPSSKQVGLYADVLERLEHDLKTGAASQRPVILKPVGSAATGTYLAGTLDIDAFLNFPEARGEAQVRCMFRSAIKRFASAYRRNDPALGLVIETYRAPRVTIKANFIYRGFTVSLAGISCSSSPGHSRCLAEDIYHHPEFCKSTAKWRREVRAMKVVRRLLALDNVFCGFACELAVFELGSAAAVIATIASGRLHIDISGKNASASSPFMSYPYTGEGNLFSKLSQTQWKRLVRACKGIAG